MDPQWRFLALKMHTAKNPLIPQNHWHTHLHPNYILYVKSIKNNQKSKIINAGTYLGIIPGSFFLPFFLEFFKYQTFVVLTFLARL